MSAEVVYRIRWYHGGGVRIHGRQQSRWYDHLRYIATKPEADRGDVEAYRVGDDDYEIERGGAAWHVRYAAERPGSEGLFGPTGPADWRETAKVLEQHELPAWRVILSMREEDADAWEMLGREKWAAAIEAAMPDVAKAMRLNPDRVRWCAAYHAKPGQPHVHLVIWEEPHRAARCQGYLKGEEFRGVKRAFMRELAREVRNRLTSEKTAIRDTVVELAGDDLRQAAAIVREIRTTVSLELQAMDGAGPGVPPILREGREADLARRLEALAAILPGRGRVAYKLMPPKVKAAADEIADWLLGQPGFYDQAAQYQEYSRALAQHYSGQQKPQDDAARNAYNDLRLRIAQQVLKAAAALDREELAREPALEEPHDPEPHDPAATAAGAHRAPGREPGGPPAPPNPDEVARELWRTSWHAADRARRREAGLAAEVARRPGLADEERIEILARLQALADKIPDQAGKPALAYLPQDQKAEARQIAAWLLRRDGFHPGDERLQEHVAQQVVVAAAALKPRTDEPPKIEYLTHEGRAEAAREKLLCATPSEAIRGDAEEVLWTAKTTYRALEALGRGDAAREVALRVVRAGGLDEAEAAKALDELDEWVGKRAFAREKACEAGVDVIGAKAWARLADNLGHEPEDFLRPWFAVKDRAQVSEELKQKAALPTPPLDPERAAEAVETLAGAAGKPADPDEARWTLWKLATTLRGLGVDEARRAEIVTRYVEQTGYEIAPHRLRDLLDYVTVAGRDDAWMGRRSWKRLMANLGIDRPPPCPWLTGPSLLRRCVQAAWRSAWAALRREVTRAEAAAALRRLRELEWQEERAAAKRAVEMGVVTR